MSGKGRCRLWSVKLATPAGAQDESLPPIATGPIDFSIGVRSWILIFVWIWCTTFYRPRPMLKASTTTFECGEGVCQGFILSPGAAERSSGLQQYSGVGTELSRTYEGEELSSA